MCGGHLISTHTYIKYMKTTALFSYDSYLFTFFATVLSCEAVGDAYAVVLNETAFFPEQGGQYADRGTLGGITVNDVQIKDGIITHILPVPLAVGETVTGIVDAETRFDRMQNHSGEHIVSGLIHTMFGYNNVGFHLSDDGLTLDTDGELTRKELLEVERAANEAVYRNVPITVSFPSAEELKMIDYRAKLDLVEDVRLITVEGVDVCACCAPHVKRTGEIGIIRIMDAIRYKCGMRIHLACGGRALLASQTEFATLVTAANALHSKREEVGDGVLRLLERLDAQKAEIVALERELRAVRAEAVEAVEGNLCLFDASADNTGLRELVNLCMPKCSGICAAFSGSDKEGYLFVMGSKAVPLRTHAKAITEALGGRGGGTDQMISGSVKASEAEIRAYMEQFPI